jgi:hypothetical protein
MKIFIVCSKHFYDKIPPIKEQLEKAGYIITLPNSYEDPFKEEDIKKVNQEEHAKWKQAMMKLQNKKIEQNDAVLVLNYEKNGMLNYIGGATFMEIVKAWELGKKVYLLNPIPSSIFEDELRGINPIILNGNFNNLV